VVSPDAIELNEVGKRSLGLDALLSQIDSVITGHISMSWLPGKLNEYEVSRVELVSEIAKLGRPPGELKLVEILSALDKELDDKFSNEDFNNSLLPAIRADIIELVTTDFQAGNTLLESIREKKFMKKKLVASGDGLTSRITQLLVSRLKICYDDCNKDDINLARFVSTRDLMIATLTTMVERQRGIFLSTLPDLIDNYFSINSLATLTLAIEVLIVELLVLPIYGENKSEKFPFVATSFAEIYTQSQMNAALAPEECCAAERAALNLQLKNLNKAILKLKELRHHD
jgi:hypothetical protein